MKKNKSISVWLVLRDGKNKGKVVLQKRFEEKFQYICQATWAGKVEPEEKIEDAVKRECEEELGTEFYNKFDFSRLVLKFTDIYIIKGGEWQANNFIGEIDEKSLKVVKLHKEALPQFIFFDKKELKYPLSSGKNPKSNVVLFDNQFKFLKQFK